MWAFSPPSGFVLMRLYSWDYRRYRVQRRFSNHIQTWTWLYIMFRKSPEFRGNHQVCLVFCVLPLTKWSPALAAISLVLIWNYLPLWKRLFFWLVLGWELEKSNRMCLILRTFLVVHISLEGGSLFSLSSRLPF